MQALLNRISQCRECEKYLALGPRPVLTADVKSKLIIIGQAPGLAVHNSGIPWDDKSGDTLRAWLQIKKEDFYNPKKVCLLPMGFCYPGKGRSGDLPPRKECAPLWHDQVLNAIEKPLLTVLIGKYAQDYYLKKPSDQNLTQTVKNYKQYLPNYLVLPHPSPRNNIWRAKNSWFDKKNLVEIQALIKTLAIF